MDAIKERRRVVRLIERLNVDFADIALIKPVRWEDRAYSAHEGFQEQIRKPTSCDVIIAILRGRIGTQLSPEFLARLPPEEQVFDGVAASTGTTYEILTSIVARQHGAKLPDIFVFRYSLAPAPSLDAADRGDIEAQWRQLQRFVEQVFITPEGHFKGALEPFASVDEFEEKAERALRQWLAENVLKGRATVWPIATKGSPFRGLEPFGAKHADVFFGRHGDRVRAIERLKTLAEDGFPFLAVVGPSGAGKSSFVRAGLVPALTKPGVVDGIATWRVAVMRPGDDDQDAIASLARHLFDGPNDTPPEDFGRPAALPELAEGHCARWQDLRGLLRLFARDASADEQERDDVRRTALAPILNALSRVAEAERVEAAGDVVAPARLLIVVDQLDEIFAADVAEQSRADFAKLLEALAATGAIWIVATLLAESFGTFLKSPFAHLLQTKGEPREPSDTQQAISAAADDVERIFKLLPPSIAELADVLRGPATAAGLEWQTDPKTGQKLDDKILADLDRSDLLPLLQFVLEQLFERRETIGETPTLTWAAYRDIGRLDGAINAAAQRALDDLDEQSRAALPRLLRALVAYPLVSGSRADAAPILRRVPLAGVTRDPGAKRLVDALRDARILISARGEDGEPVIALAHQRVIEAWATAGAIIAENKTLLRTRANIEVACDAWLTAEQSPDHLIPPGRRLLDAEAVVATLKDELSPEQRDFVARSGRAARFRQRLVAAAAVVFCATAIVAAASAYFFFDARNRAERALGAAKQAINRLDGFIWSANQGSESMAGVRLDKVQASVGEVGHTLDDLLAQAPDDLDLLAVRATNSANSVAAYLAAHSLKDASTAADDGVATAAHMARLAAADPRALKAQVMAAYKRADVRRESLDLEGALADCREAQRLAATLVAKTGSDVEALRLQWVAAEKLGEALLAAHDGASRATLEQATGLARALLRSAPSDPARQRDVALSLASEGRAALAEGDATLALARFGDYLDAARNLAADHPADPLFRRDEALALISVAGAKFSKGDASGALADLKTALGIVQRLANDDPLNARAKHDVLAALVTRAQINLRGDKAAARADLDQALTMARDFAAVDGGSARSRFDLATVLMQLALNFDDAKPFADQARAIAASLAQDNLLTPADKATLAQFERQMQ